MFIFQRKEHNCTILTLRCDHCTGEFERKTNIRRQLNMAYHFCSRRCSQGARAKSGVLRLVMEETMRRKMGDDWASQIGQKINKSQTPEQRKARGRKAKQTVFERYGANSACQIPHVRKACMNARIQPDVIANQQATVLARFGVKSVLSLPEVHVLANSPEAQKKRHETMKRNGAYYKSRPEEQCYLLLCERYGTVERQVWMNGWAIDFYVPCIDTYVQEDGVYLHGLDRQIEIIKECKTKKDAEIYRKWQRDREQDEWFKSTGRRLLRITDKQVLLGDLSDEFK